MKYIILSSKMNNTQNQVNDFLGANAWWMAIVLAALILITILIIVLTGKKRKGRKPKRLIVASSYYEAFGGIDNVISHARTGSRINLVLKDYDLVDKEKLKEAGVDGFIKMSDRLVLVIKGDAEAVELALFPPSEASE